MLFGAFALGIRLLAAAIYGGVLCYAQAFSTLGAAIRGAPIRVVRVVVVEVAIRIDIPRIVGVAAISRAQAGIDRRASAYCHLLPFGRNPLLAPLRQLRRSASCRPRAMP